MNRIIILGMLLSLSILTFGQMPYQNAALPAEQRAEDLLGRLTLEEKVGLMQNNSAGVKRLGIKPYEWWNEALHGVARSGLATVFPQAIGMAASFDDSLVYTVFTAVSDEARVKNRLARAKGQYKRYQGLTFWTPNVNIFRDPRWGRGQETYGEDPYLTSRMGVAVVRGLQGPEDARYDKAHACAKHFAVHSGPEWNRHSFNAKDIDLRDLYETYLPAFKALVQEAGVKEVMCAYNRFEDEPCCGNNQLLHQILREEWGYKGIVVSDCGAINDFYTQIGHRTHPDGQHASAAAVTSGTDLECGTVYKNLVEAVKKGLVSQERIDTSVKRLLKARFELGEMDPSTPWDTIPAEVLDSPEHRALALKMARKSMVLLQNKGLLPLSKQLKVAVMGPNANDTVMQWGNYNGFPSHTVSLLEGVRAKLPEAQVIYESGCDHIGQKYTQPKENTLLYVDIEKAMAQDIEAAVAKVKDADVVIFGGGISPNFEGEEMRNSPEGFKKGDRTHIELPAIQRRLLAALKAAGKKIVLVNFSGSAIGLTPETETCDAILQAWYPGQAGGTAIADILFGDYNPAGRLPITFYKNTEQLPDFENYSMKGRTYRYMTETPLFPFGYGLSYTSFVYKKTKYKDGILTVQVKNTGKTDGEEVVQVYLSRPGDVAGPHKTLRAFKRISIPAGKTVKVEFALNDKTFEWWDEATGLIKPLSGKYEIFYGGSSAGATNKIMVER